jgi:hypothetical protein
LIYVPFDHFVELVGTRQFSALRNVRRTAVWGSLHGYSFMCRMDGISITRYKFKLSCYVNNYTLFCYKYDSVCCTMLSLGRFHPVIDHESP